MKLKSLAFCAAVLFTLQGTDLRAQSIENTGCCDVQLPEPFNTVEPAELVRALYPGYDSESRLLGKAAVDKDGNPLAGQVYDAALWKGSTDPRLLVLVETYTPEADGSRPAYGAASYGLDLAAFAQDDGKLHCIAKLQAADTHSGHSDLTFDQAPYRVDSTTRAFGLRETYLHMGHRVERLKLFVQDGATFQPIFERPMLDSLLDAYTDPLEGDLDAAKMKEIYEGSETLSYANEAVLAVVPGQNGENSFRITEKRRERRADGTLTKETVTELWAWDGTSRHYAKKS